MLGSLAPGALKLIPGAEDMDVSSSPTATSESDVDAEDEEIGADTQSDDGLPHPIPGGLDATNDDAGRSVSLSSTVLVCFLAFAVSKNL